MSATAAADALLTHDAIDALMAHPFWEPLDPELERLIQHLPQQGPKCERTTMLTWIYGQQGVMSYLELVDRITIEDIRHKKRHVRGYLRGLEKLQLVSIVNFPCKDGEEPDEEGVLGPSSMVSLTWLGMVWMNRAWQARARFHPGSPKAVLWVHSQLVEEEDDGKANEPYWVENMPNRIDGEAPASRIARLKGAAPGITSVFDLAGPKRRR